MTVPNELQEYSICAMYRDGVTLHRLEIAFDRTSEELLEVLHRHGVIGAAAVADHPDQPHGASGAAEDRAA